MRNNHSERKEMLLRANQLRNGIDSGYQPQSPSGNPTHLRSSRQLKSDFSKGSSPRDLLKEQNQKGHTNISSEIVRVESVSGIAERIRIQVKPNRDVVSRTIVNPGKSLNLPSLVEMSAESHFNRNGLIRTVITTPIDLVEQSRPHLALSENCHRFSIPPSDPAGRRVDVSDRPLLCMSSSCDGGEVVVGSADHALYSIDVRNARKKHIQMYSKRFGHSDWVTSCAHLSDNRVISAGMDGKLCLWSTDRRTCEDLDGHQRSISKVIVDETTNAAVSCGYDGRIIIWNIPVAAHMPRRLSSSSQARGKMSTSSKPSPAAIYESGSTPVLDICYHSGHLLSGSRDGKVAVWDMGSSAMIRRYNGHSPAPVTVVDRIGNSGSCFVTGGGDGMVHIFDIRSSSNSAAVSIPAHSSARQKTTGAVGALIVMGSSLSPGRASESDDYGLIVTGGSDSTVAVFDCRKNFGEVSRWSEHRNCVYTLCGVGDRCVFSGDGTGMMFCYDILGGGGEVGGLKYGIGASLNSAVKSILCAGGRIVTAGEDGKVLVFDYL